MKRLLKFVWIICFFIAGVVDGQEYQLPQDEINTVDIFGKTIIDSQWDLEKADINTPYYFNYFADRDKDKVIRIVKQNDRVIINPIEMNDNEMIVEFFKNDKIVHKSTVPIENIKGGPNYYLNNFDGVSTIYKTAWSAKKPAWVIVAAIAAACCVKVTYTYTSGNPPKHSVKVAFDCNCLKIELKNSSSGIPFIVDGKTIMADYFVMSTSNNVKNSNLGLIVSK